MILKNNKIGAKETPSSARCYEYLDPTSVKGGCAGVDLCPSSGGDDAGWIAQSRWNCELQIQ